MTDGDERAAAVQQLEEALRTDDGDEKDVHIRQAIQLLQIEAKAVPANVDSADERAQ